MDTTQQLHLYIMWYVLYILNELIKHFLLCWQDGRTALHHALVHGVVEGDMDTTQQLIDFGCDVNVKDEVGDLEIVDLLSIGRFSRGV